MPEMDASTLQQLKALAEELPPEERALVFSAVKGSIPARRALQDRALFRRFEGGEEDWKQWGQRINRFEEAIRAAIPPEYAERWHPEARRKRAAWMDELAVKLGVAVEADPPKSATDGPKGTITVNVRGNQATWRAPRETK